MRNVTTSMPVGYARISYDREGAGLGVGRQAADIRDLAARLGLPQPEIITDNDASAYSGKRRPGYERLLAGLRDGRWTILLVWHVDRLTRNPKDLEELVDVLNARSIGFHTVRGGMVDLSSAEGRLQARILGSLARYESEHRGDRVRRAALAGALDGKPHGGLRPFGYESGGLTVRPDEEAVLVEVADRVVRGDSLYSICRDLDARGIPTVGRAKRWHAPTLRETLLSPRYAGLRAYRGEILTTETPDGGTVEVRAAWPAILKRETWEAVRAILSDPARRTSPGNQPTTLLSALARCGVCGALARTGRSSRGVPAYRCKTDSCVMRPVELVDRVVVRCVTAWLARDGAAFDAGRAGPAVDVRGQVDALRVLVAEAEDALLGNPPEHLKGVSLAAVRRNLDRHRARLEELQRSEVLSGLPSPVEGVTPENLGSLPLERRRAVVAYLVQVTIRPAVVGRRAGEDTVSVVPKPRG